MFHRIPPGPIFARILDGYSDRYSDEYYKDETATFVLLKQGLFPDKFQDQDNPQEGSPWDSPSQCRLLWVNSVNPFLGQVLPRSAYPRGAVIRIFQANDPSFECDKTWLIRIPHWRALTSVLRLLDSHPWVDWKSLPDWITIPYPDIQPYDPINNSSPSGRVGELYSNWNPWLDSDLESAGSLVSEEDSEEESEEESESSGGIFVDSDSEFDWVPDNYSDPHDDYVRDDFSVSDNL